MYYVSIADDHSGTWMGACFVNAPSQAEAAPKAAEIANGKRCLSLAIAEVPPGSPGIPAGFYGRLLSRSEVESIGRLRHFVVDENGGVEVEP